MTDSLLKSAASALHAAGGQTTFNETFRQGIHNDDRKCRDQRCRHHATPDVIWRTEERVQPDRQREVAGAGQENGGEQIVIPRHHEAVDKDRHQTRDRQRHGDAEDDLQAVQAVHHRGFFDFVRDGVEIAAA